MRLLRSGDQLHVQFPQGFAAFEVSAIQRNQALIKSLVTSAQEWVRLDTLQRWLESGALTLR